MKPQPTMVSRVLPLHVSHRHRRTLVPPILSAPDPAGTTLVVWASFDDEDPVGEEVQPCSKKGGRDVLGCQVTAVNLGVYFRTRTEFKRGGWHNTAADNKLPEPLPLEAAAAQPGGAQDVIMTQADEDEFEPIVAPYLADAVDVADEAEGSEGEFGGAGRRSVQDMQRSIFHKIFAGLRGRRQPLAPRDSATATATTKTTSPIIVTWGSLTWAAVTGTKSYPTIASTVTNADSATDYQTSTGLVTQAYTTTVSLPAPTSTTTSATPTVSCIYQDATPENPAACTCVSGPSTTIVQPMTKASVSVMTQSCAYSTWPSNQPTVTTPPSTVTTNFAGMLSSVQSHGIALY